MTDDALIAAILLGEAAGEGEEGLRFVRDVMVNRARAQKKTLHQIATAPKQFSASARPDLAEFAEQQPLALRVLAHQLVMEGMNPKFQPTYPGIQHYTTTQFFENRGKLPSSHWVHQMEPVQQVGAHVALRPRARSR